MRGANSSSAVRSFYGQADWLVGARVERLDSRSRCSVRRLGFEDEEEDSGLLPI